MTKVDIGTVDPAQHSVNQQADAGPAKIGVSGFPSAPVLNAITADLASREPEVAAFIKNMSFPNDVISTMLAWKENNAAADAHRWIDGVGLTGNKNAYPHQLSGGMQQRVGLARALTSNAEIMLWMKRFRR